MKLLFSDESSLLAQKVLDFVKKVESESSFELQTSGTTGAPKRIAKDIKAALEKKRGGKSSDTFLLTFDPERWAGASVLLHCIRFECAIVVPRSLEFSDIITAADFFKPRCVSLTPTMMRTLLMVDVAKVLPNVPFSQITFGGEAASQGILNLSKSLWPHARITHTYASTEHGDICAVSDGLEGIPESKFVNYTWNWEGDIGELIINGVSTGDLWRKQDERFLFVGRKEEVINVGGNKVSPLVVEEAALKLGVDMARAYAVPSPLMGSLVALDYVGTIEKIEILKGLREFLPKYACPVSVNKVETLTVTPGGKLKRL